MKTAHAHGPLGFHRRAGVALVGLAALAVSPACRHLASPPQPAPLSAAARQATVPDELAAFVAQFSAAIGIKLVPIPAGTFTMGSAAGEADRNADEGPPTQVTLTEDFFLA